MFAKFLGAHAREHIAGKKGGEEHAIQRTNTTSIDGMVLPFFALIKLCIDPWY